MLDARPVSDSAPSVLPWYAPVAASTSERPLRARTSFSAASTASAPELANTQRRGCPGATAASASPSASACAARYGCTIAGVRASSAARTAAATSGAA